MPKKTQKVVIVSTQNFSKNISTIFKLFVVKNIFLKKRGAAQQDNTIQNVLYTKFNRPKGDML